MVGWINILKVKVSEKVIPEILLRCERNIASVIECTKKIRSKIWYFSCDNNKEIRTGRNTVRYENA